MDFLGILDLVNKMGEAKRIGSEMIEPASQMMDQAKFKIADTLGYTNEMVDDDDASIYKKVDEKAFQNARENFRDTAASLAKFDPMKPGVVQASPVAPMQQVPMNQAYSPVNYGQMPAQGMFGQQPTYEQLLKALQSRGY